MSRHALRGFEENRLDVAAQNATVGCRQHGLSSSWSECLSDIRWGNLHRKAMKALGLPFVVFCAALASAAAERGQEQLLRLGKEPHSLRSAPLDLTNVAVCPKGPDLSVLDGLRRQDILCTLGAPDVCARPLAQSCERSREWAYLFVNSKELPRGLRGGGFPELTCEFDERDTVIAVSCHYAR